MVAADYGVDSERRWQQDGAGEFAPPLASKAERHVAYIVGMPIIA
jgi:hypothetical protein